MIVTKKRAAVALGVALAGAAFAITPATGASASGGCKGDLITINGGRGAEAPSQAYGHKHRTGNHYITAYSGKYVIWWADNNGGSDGDTRDSFHTSTFCG